MTNKNRRSGNVRRKNSSTNIIKIVLYVLLIFFLFILFFVLKSSFNTSNNDVYSSSPNNIASDNTIENNKNNFEDNFENKDDFKENKKEINPITFNLASIGDIMCHNTQFRDAYNPTTKNYNFDYVFDDIKYYTSTADLTIGNIETSFGGAERGYSNYPRFNTPDALAYSLKNIGVDVISTAGNHCLDLGFDGLSRTLSVLDDADISHTGTFTSQFSRDTVLFKYIKGIKIGILSYTYGTNGIPVPTDKKYCVNLIDKNLILSDIKRAKEGGAEFIISCMHWGSEYMLSANEEQKELSNFLFQNGVDIILGNHPHVTQPMEQRTVTLEDGTKKDCFVIFAMGNFICDQRYPHTRSSIILDLTITKNIDNSFSIDKVKYIPIYMLNDTSLTSKKMSLVDINSTIQDYENNPNSTVKTTLYNTLKSELAHLQKILGE